MITTIIFDWDGVIVDSMPIIALGIVETAASYGKQLTLEEVLDGYFQPRLAYYKSIGIDITDEEELNKRHWAAIEKHHRPAPFFPESAAVLRFLKDRGLKLGVGSTAKTDHIIEQLKSAGLEDIFETETIIGGELHKEEKLRHLIGLFNVPLDEILYVGDLPSDITAAHAVGIQAGGIERREVARQKLAALHPEFLFTSLDDLAHIFKN
jgi:phosphoglycolate phosphatase/pyrophosphatase PpaX